MAIFDPGIFQRSLFGFHEFVALVSTPSSASISEVENQFQ
jgi:hypothetical protein